MPRGGGVREGECSRAFHTGKPLRGFEEASQESKTGRKARSLVIEGKGHGLWPFPGPTPSRAEGKPSDPFPRNQGEVGRMGWELCCRERGAMGLSEVGRIQSTKGLAAGAR